MKKRLYSVDAFCLLLLAAVTFFYISRVIHKPIWYDELFSWSIARLSIGDIWRALGNGVDLNPPFIYVAIKASSAIFGDGNWGTRLPSALAMCVIGLGIYAFVRTRASAWTALGASLLPISIALYDWGSEARPYALMLAACALAFYCWQKAADAQEEETAAAPDIEYSMSVDALRGERALNKPSLKWPILLALSLALGISSHYYAIFIWLPLAVGEAVRSWRRRRISWTVWMAFLAGIAPLFLYLPLIASSRPYMAGFWSKSFPREDIIQFYRVFVKPAFWPFALVMLLWAAYSAWFLIGARKSSAQAPAAQAPAAQAPAAQAPAAFFAGDANSTRRPLRIEQWAACFVLSLVPVIATFFALLTHRGYTLRYAAIGVIGCYLGMALLVTLSERKWPPLGKIFALAVLVNCVVGQRSNMVKAAQISAEGMATSPLLVQTTRLYPAGLPIAVASPLRFALAYKYGDANLKSRLVYLADNALAVRFMGNDTNDRGLGSLARWSDVPTRDFKTFRAKHKSFLLYEYADLHWLTPQTLRKLGASTRLLKKQNGESLYLVTWR